MYRTSLAIAIFKNYSQINLQPRMYLKIVCSCVLKILRSMYDALQNYMGGTMRKPVKVSTPCMKWCHWRIEFISYEKQSGTPVKRYNSSLEDYNIHLHG